MVFAHIIVFPFVMVLYEFMDVVSEISSKYVDMRGIPARIFAGHRFILAALILSPIAVIIHRKMNQTIKFTWEIVLYGFMCALCGIFSAIIEHFGSTLTATSLGDTSPVFVYILAVLFRFEKLSINTRDGKLKIIGTLMACTGSMVITFVEGREIMVWPNKLIFHYKEKNISYKEPSFLKRFFGDRADPSLLLRLINPILLALSTITKAKMLEKYTSIIGCSTLILTMEALQLMVINVCIDKHIYLDYVTALWPLVFLAIPYIAIAGTVLLTLVEAFYIYKNGPFLVAIYKPVGLILMAILSPIFVGDKLHVGSVVGTVIIIIGILMVEWGKRENVENASPANLNIVPETHEMATPAGTDEMA